MAKSGLTGGQGMGEFFSRGPGGILPEKGSQAQYDMVRAMLQSGVGAAQNSGSPLLAMLAPMIGGAVATRTQGLYDQAQQERATASSQQLLGLLGNNPRAASILEIMNDQNAPDHVKSIAASMMGKVVNPPKGRAAAARKMREDVNGILRYLDTGDQVFPGVTKAPGSNAGDLRQANTATQILDGAITDLVLNDGLSREEARELVQSDPMYALQWAMIGPGATGAPQATPRVPETELAKPDAARADAGRLSPPPPPEGTVEF
jgi:hypothetical protein